MTQDSPEKRETLETADVTVLLKAKSSALSLIVMASGESVTKIGNGDSHCVFLEMGKFCTIRESE